MPRKKRTRRGRQRRRGGYLLFFLLGSIATLCIYTIITQEEPSPPEQKRAPSEPLPYSPPSTRLKDQRRPPETAPPPPRGTGPSVTSPRPSAQVAIVIDDLGRESSFSRQLLQWNLPITFSILPFEPHSRDLAIEAHQKGKEVILHLPMEPHGYPKIKPGEGALLLEMTERSLLRQLSRDIEAVPHIKGVSNHMGSRFMEDSKKMKLILSELKRRGFFFLDSRTTPQSVGAQTANAIGLESGERAVFLDHDVSEDAIRRSLQRLARLSLTPGKAIGIGHPHEATLRSLKRMIPEMQEKGIEVVPLSVILE